MIIPFLEAVAAKNAINELASIIAGYKIEPMKIQIGDNDDGAFLDLSGKLIKTAEDLSLVLSMIASFIKELSGKISPQVILEKIFFFKEAPLTEKEADEFATTLNENGVIATVIGNTVTVNEHVISSKSEINALRKVVEALT